MPALPRAHGAPPARARRRSAAAVRRRGRRARGRRRRLVHGLSHDLRRWPRGAADLLRAAEVQRRAVDLRPLRRRRDAADARPGPLHAGPRRAHPQRGALRDLPHAAARAPRPRVPRADPLPGVAQQRVQRRGRGRGPRDDEVVSGVPHGGAARDAHRAHADGLRLPHSGARGLPQPRVRGRQRLHARHAAGAPRRPLRRGGARAAAGDGGGDARPAGAPHGDAQDQRRGRDRRRAPLRPAGKKPRRSQVSDRLPGASRVAARRGARRR